MQSIRRIFEDAFHAAILAANPAVAVQSALTQTPIPDVDGRIITIAIGKAAVAMSDAAARIVAADHQIIVSNPENLQGRIGGSYFAAGHPIPDQVGLDAGQAIIALMSETGPDDFILFLISGGGSALLPAPLPGISLAQKQQLNAKLLASGAPIDEMNLIRQQFSQLKGGKLALLARPARMKTLAISDVIGDDIRAIASGPTAAPLGTAEEAKHLLRSYGIWDGLPPNMRAALENQPNSDDPLEPNDTAIIASNGQSVSAAALALEKLGFSALIAPTPLIGDVADAASRIVDTISQARGDRPLAYVFGGETTVNLRGAGRGGRNQELALRVALGIENAKTNWAFLSAGTDGRDGPTDAAGGIVDGQSLFAMQKAGIDAQARVEENDSYPALEGVQGLFKPGPTGTNVADIQIALVFPKDHHISQ